VAVYVDNMKAAYRGMVMCHMVADTEQELRDMAFKIGVPWKRLWLRLRTSLWNDLTKSDSRSTAKLFVTP
jgi:hypothetical protein